MQRVRIGLTGLAFVFLLVLLAAVFSRASNEKPITANMIEQQRTPEQRQPQTENLQQAEPSEPLAELGVAPGNADANLTIAVDRPPDNVAPE